MARFLRKPSLSDHRLNDLKLPGHRTGGDRSDDGPRTKPEPLQGTGRPDREESPNDQHDSNGHHRPPSQSNHAPQILSAERVGQVREGDSAELLTVSGRITFRDKDFADTHVARVEFVSTTHPSGQQYGALEAVVTPGAGAASLKTTNWGFAVNDAEIQHLSEGEVVRQTYRVSVIDAAGKQASSLVTVRLTGSNDAPTASAVALVADENPVTGSFAGGDVDSDDSASTLTYEILGQPTGGTFINNGDGTFSFDPGQDFRDLALGQTREVAVAYRAIDRHGAVSNEGTITVAVMGTRANEGPVVGAPIDPQTAVEEASFNYVVPSDAFADPNGDALTLSATLANGSPLPAWLSFDPATGSFSGTPDDPDVGTIDVAVRANDPSGEFAQQTFRLSITPVNDPPVIENQSFSIPEQSAAGAVVGTVMASDIDSSALTFRIVGGDSGPFALDKTTGEIVLSRDVTNADVGTYSLMIEATDGQFRTPATVTFTVDPVNDDPTGQPVISGAFQIGQQLTTDLSAVADPDGLPADPASFSYQWESSPDGMVWTPVTGASAPTFAPGFMQLGLQLRAVVTYTDNQGFAESVTSAPTAAISPSAGGTGEGSPGETGGSGSGSGGSSPVVDPGTGGGTPTVPVEPPAGTGATSPTVPPAEAGGTTPTVPVKPPVAEGGSPPAAPVNPAAPPPEPTATLPADPGASGTPPSEPDVQPEHPMLPSMTDFYDGMTVI